MKKYTVLELIEGVLAQDDKVFLYLYQVSFKEVLWLVRKNNGSEEDAKEIFQEAMVILITKIKEEGLRFTCSPKTYLYAVCRNLWLKELARRNRKANLSVEETEFVAGDDCVEVIEDQDLLNIYIRHFKELSEECKKILNLHLKNLPIREITRRMGFKRDSYTMDRKYRCKKSLIKKIEANPQYKKLNEGR